MTDPIVRIADIRRALPGQTCSRGIRGWFKANGLDYGSFLNNGIPASALAATGDTYGLKVANYMKESTNGR